MSALTPEEIDAAIQSELPGWAFDSEAAGHAPSPFA